MVYRIDLLYSTVNNSLDIRNEVTIESICVFYDR